jgi:type IV pilus assembly protein PilQ
MNRTKLRLIIGLGLTPVLSLAAIQSAMAQSDSYFDRYESAQDTIENVDQTRAEQWDEVMPAPTQTPAPTEQFVRTGDVELDLQAGQTAGQVVRDAETISVDFPDEDVRNIIRNVADLYELNVVIPDTLVGRSSLKLRDVTWRQVFRVVLEPLNYTWIEDENIIKIRNRDELMAEPVATRVYVVNFANAGEMQSAIAPLVDTQSGGRIQVDSRSNSLVITERPSRMNEIQAIIERLDRPTEQVMIESKFVEITKRDQKNLGVDWASLSGYGLQAGPFGRQYENDRGRTTGSINRDSDTTISDGITQTRTLESELSNQRSYDSSLSRLDTAVFSAEAFSVVLSALQTNNDIQLISNPTVVTLNNSPARINIGEKYPIPNYSYNAEQGTFEVSGFDYKDIGIILQVTPQINSAGFINLNIAPTISSRSGEVNFGGAGGASIPILAERSTQSTVTIKSGYTLAIGGLIESQTSNRTSKVPVLGNVPLMGRLFSSTSTGTDARNLVVFITAKILSADGSTYRDVFSPRTLFEMGIQEKDIPGIGVRTEEDELFERLMQARDNIERSQTQQRLRQQLQVLEAAEQTEASNLDEIQQERPIRRRFQ